MCKRMKSSIQEYCKKINRELTFVSILSLFLTVVTLFALTGYLYFLQGKNRSAVMYKETDVAMREVASLDGSRPFGSNKGTTYTFSWCQGANRILDKNKVYFSSEEEAKISGRRLSKLCQK